MWSGLHLMPSGQTLVLDQESFGLTWHWILYFVQEIPKVILLKFRPFEGETFRVSSEIKRTYQLTFRIELAHQLTDGYSSRKRKECPASFQAKKFVVSDDMRLASMENHVPKMVSNYRRLLIDIKEQMMANVEFEAMTTIVTCLKRVKIGLEKLCSRSETLLTVEGVFSFVIEELNEQNQYLRKI
ncbi:hypothetical protein TNCV_3753841 [Trichonephila clavipes]|nr:hypothetical protein TNCV_3753841 [Trichonephila clavipes]